jgi:hypothetical protein
VDGDGIVWDAAHKAVANGGPLARVAAVDAVCRNCHEGQLVVLPNGFWPGNDADPVIPANWHYNVIRIIIRFPIRTLGVYLDHLLNRKMSRHLNKH